MKYLFAILTIILLATAAFGEGQPLRSNATDNRPALIVSTAIDAERFIADSGVTITPRFVTGDDLGPEHMPATDPPEFTVTDPPEFVLAHPPESEFTEMEALRISEDKAEWELTFDVKFNSVTREEAVAILKRLLTQNQNACTVDFNVKKRDDNITATTGIYITQPEQGVMTLDSSHTILRGD